jgi:hypothetical protein
MSQFKEQQGFLTIAVNTNEVDYLNLAYLQALNVKTTQKVKSFAIVVDENTLAQITEEHKKVFDYIIPAQKTNFGPYEIETQVFWLTPFKETIKLESDLLLPISIDHWWNIFRLRDLVLSLGCKNYLGEKSNVRKYRKLFDDNTLPDVYNGLMYFRYSKTSADFFRKSAEIFQKWDLVKKELSGCDDKFGTTDVVYGLAAKILGIENFTIPTVNFINFVHMKPAINNFNEEFTFNEVFITEFYKGNIRINNINQYHPLHYYDKQFPTKEMYDYFRSMAGIH